LLGKLYGGENVHHAFLNPVGVDYEHLSSPDLSIDP
jgi:hypothetical protein